MIIADVRIYGVQFLVKSLIAFASVLSRKANRSSGISALTDEGKYSLLSCRVNGEFHICYEK